MKIKTYYHTKNGKVKVEIQIGYMTPAKVKKLQIQDKKIRNSWCTYKKPCLKYGCRPCCPPKVKLFNELKERKHFFGVMVRLNAEDYFTYSPKSKELPVRKYLFMGVAHKITRTIQNKIANSFKGQIFRVGGCLGCSYKKNGKCMRFAPALEATGIDVNMLAKQMFDTEIEWAIMGQPIDVLNMTAVGGIYTNTKITKNQFREVIKDVVRNK
jgi:predicted metal-binding protein